MKTGAASGLQIAFFTFAFLLLAVPVNDWIAALRPWSPEMQALLDKATLACLGVVVLFGIPPVRRACLDLLRPPLPRDARAEVAAVAALKVVLPLGVIGGIALWLWIRGGAPAVAYYVGQWGSEERELQKAFLVPHMMLMLVVAGVIGPVLEEIVFRGFLYRAWERQWGWFASMLLTSLLFGLYHSTSTQAFLGSVVFVCLYRRTGSLWAPIIAHIAGNIALWYPLLGRHLVPRGEAPGDISAWGLQLACLLAIAVAIPVYAWMARRAREPAVDFAPTLPHGALPE